DIESAISENNAEPGSMTVRDGYYEYNINISNQLRTPDDVRRIFLRKADRLMQLGDFCEVELVANNPQGYSMFNGKRAVTLAIIKQSEENMDRLKESLTRVTAQFERRYPQLEFTQSRNQTELLDYTISNLVQNLILGFLLVVLLTAWFMGNLRASVVIGITIVASVIITFMLFYLCGVSINVISLSGLILAVGMMIDNSVIVTENITQLRQRGLGLADACDKGTSEMITPMLSSSLTTVAVFVPLVFMSGIAGAIFRDQAFAITAGLAVSYIVGIMLLPVIYKITFRSHKPGVAGKSDWAAGIYTRVIDWCFAHKALCLTLTALTIPACVLLFKVLPVERMPQIDRDDALVRVEWNENISVDENSRRVASLIEALDTANVTQYSASIGIQDYLLDNGSDLSASEAEIYFKAKSPAHLTRLLAELSASMAEQFPRAETAYLPSENIFEKIFSTNEPMLEARLHSTSPASEGNPDELMALESRLTDELTPLRERINLVIDREKLLLYNVRYSDVAKTLLTAFKANSAGTLRSYQQYLPITISGQERTVEEILAETLVGDVPLSALVTIRRDREIKSIMAGADGEYVPLAFDSIADPQAEIARIQSVVDETSDWDVAFAGSVFSNRKMMRELTVILAISLLLMYFILCAQFGNFLQPLIVLVEIPIDTAFALITLWICGHTLNLMSAIGIIVTCGIVVNDSILKLDAINELRSQGTPLMEAIHTAGVRRLRPIIMTSLTTILAMVPMLFTNDMGSELQRPLAIAMIGSMIVGTLVSIFIIPLIYWLIYSHEK
ncbi:MAG: efflux RND transporter permease subunit, partial [Muribaculaceae bacterium]|nr:efflux RND transporter permease subunit [Muribaculaceae bacterium]